MKDNPRILLVDDKVDITAQLSPTLKRAGFNVAAAGDGEEALRRVADFAPDLIVLDVDMPKLDGREVCRRLRAANNWTPIIMLTKYADLTDKVMSLEEGADDYLTKPYDAFELIARIRAVLRRRPPPGVPPLTAATRLACSAFILDRAARRVLISDRELPLTPLAVTLLDYLMTHHGELLTRERLLDAVWGWDYAGGTRAVDMRIAELRKHLEDSANDPRYIETVPSQGYIFIGHVEVVP
jgi:DNA-binding response OmpR family regulator